MERKDFPIFSNLLSEVHAKAFGEPISSKLVHSKAQTLSWLIYDATGELLSYKSLANYISAVLRHEPETVNPTVKTLAILAQFVAGSAKPVHRNLEWFRYRSCFFGSIAV